MNITPDQHAPVSIAHEVVTHMKVIECFGGVPVTASPTTGR
jgi:hypothetical protein